MGEVLTEVFEKVVRDGIKYLVKRTVNSIGKKIKEFFRDEDDDGVPDTEEPEFVEDDDEEISGGEETSGAGESGSELPTTSEPVRPPAETSQPAQTIGDIILMTPDGPIIIYTESGGEQYDALVSRVTEQWVEKYGAMDKPLHNYSVSEALLFIIAAGTVVSLFCKLFKRRKL